MKTTVARWGTTLALRIPRGIAAKAQLSEGVEVELAAEANGITVRRIASSDALSKLLAKLRPGNRHTWSADDPARGVESW